MPVPPDEVRVGFPAGGEGAFVSKAWFIVIAVCAVWASESWALEPARTEMSLTEMVLKVGRREQVVHVPRAVPATAARPSQSSPATHAPARKWNRPVTAGNSPAAVQQKHASHPSPANKTLPPVVPTLRELRTPATSGAANKLTEVPNASTSASPAKPALLKAPKPLHTTAWPKVKAKAMLCVDCSANRVVLNENGSEPMPIASITKLLTAMVVADEMKLDTVLKVPAEIREVPRHKVGIKPGDLLSARDLLHGMLIESGNDCAETLARSYPKGGRDAFVAAMNRKASRLGATHTKVFTPSGLDEPLILGRKDGRTLATRKANTASARDVALIARHAFQYPLISDILSLKSYAMRTHNDKPRTYQLATNDKLLYGKLPVAGAKTGFTNKAGKCIVALFKKENTEHMVVVLNTQKHFNAAEKIYRWATEAF